MEDSRRRWDRLVGLLFLLLVLVAVGLLIAGYGVAVGAGAFAGLVLGFLAGTIGSLWLERGSGRSITFGSMEWSAAQELVATERPDLELMAEMDESAAVSSVDLGEIRSVTPVLANVEAGGLEIQLVTVEVHDAGLSMTFDVVVRPGTLPPAQAARVAIRDDAGTAYRAAAQVVGGSRGRLRYALTAIPVPPPAATRLEVTIEGFTDPFPSGRRHSTGPWGFSVALPGRGGTLGA